jgi:hypothetical protein
LPDYLYVEGYETSAGMKDVELALEYTVESRTLEDKIKVTIVDMDLKEVSFSGTKYHMIKKDDNTIDFDAPHWQDNSSPPDGDAEDTGDRKYPVAYTSSATGADSYMKTAVKIEVTPAAAFTSGTKIKATNSDGYNFSDDGTLSGTELSFDSGQVQCDKKFDNEKVGYLNPLELKWEVSRDGGAIWYDVAKSKNIVYVCWKEPTPSTLWETPLKIGCEKAKDKTTQPEIISETWGEFTDCVVKRVDNKQMTYWKNSPTNQSLQAMLAASDGDGSCIAWSQLLHWCMESQGLGSVSQVWMVDEDDSVNPNADGFLVKEWKFGKHIRTGTDSVRDSAVVPDDQEVTPGGADTPCILPGPNGKLDSTPQGNDTEQDGLYAGTNYPYVVGLDARDQDGVEAQGYDNPPGAFEEHWVCKIDGDLYDPSYGLGSYPTELAHENATLDGILDNPRCKKNDPAQEIDYSRDGSKE